MKIATLLAKHGLTLPQYRALTITHRTRVVRVSGCWRYRGGSRPLTADVVGRLSEMALVAIDEASEPARAVATERGCALLIELEGQR